LQEEHVDMHTALLENDGQIKYNSNMGKIIAHYSQDTRFSRYLELGTWNGGGSTYCFAKGFESRHEPFQFVSLEINEELHNEAKSKYVKLPHMNLFKGRIIKDEEFPNINTVLEMFEHVNIQWLKDDVSSFFKTPYFDVDSYNPEVVLLDGSEYLTYFEFKKLYNTTKVFILDDISTDKCKKIVQELKNNTMWKEVHFMQYERNGWAVYETTFDC
jgi:hypothetical protein